MERSADGRGKPGIPPGTDPEKSIARRDRSRHGVTQSRRSVVPPDRVRFADPTVSGWRQQPARESDGWARAWKTDRHYRRTVDRKFLERIWSACAGAGGGRGSVREPRT